MIDRDKLITTLHASLLRDADYTYCGDILVRVFRVEEFEGELFIGVKSADGGIYQPPITHWFFYSTALDE